VDYRREKQRRERDMRVRVVRDRSGRAVCAVQLEPIERGQVLADPILEDGEQVEDVELSDDSLLDPRRLDEV